LQGWLKGINSDSLNADFDIANDGKIGSAFSRVSRDVYGFKLGYFNNDFTPIGAGAVAFNNKNYTAPGSLDNSGNQLYNGNISFSTLTLSKINSGNTVGYSYGYDQLNRLVEMRQHVTGTTGGWGNSNIITAYRESIAYDANGNILKYLRKGTAATPDMDSLNYKYNLDVNGKLANNKLNHVRDQVSSSNYTIDIDNQSSNNYVYDLIGNLKKDVAEGIDTIRWTVYGKINKIVKTGSDIEYRYDAGGSRTSKKVFGAADTTTFYVRDAQGNVLAVYEKKNSAAITWEEQHLYGSSRLGMWRWDTIVPTAPPIVQGGTPIYDSITFGSRQYELSNHLGNVLSVISDKKIGHNNGSNVVDYYVTEVLSQNDYYPFGLDMPGRGFNSGASYRYGFNNKEKDNDINGKITYDFKFRIYNPALGKFLSVDPLTKDFSFYSPYHYAGNTPIWAIDLDGREPLTYQEWKSRGWSSKENFEKIQGSKNHIKVINFGNLHNDGHNYIAIRDQKIENKWWYASYDNQIGSLGNKQKGNWKLYNPEISKYNSWTPEGWQADDAEIKREANHLGTFGRAYEGFITNTVIFGTTAPLGGIGSWGSRLFLNTAVEVGVNGKNADVADIVTSSLPGAGGLVGVGAGSFLDWTPGAEKRADRLPSSLLFPNTFITKHKSLQATGVDILTGVTYEGLKFMPKKTIKNLTPGQNTFIDVSGTVQEKVMNKIIKDGIESQQKNQTP